MSRIESISVRSLILSVGGECHDGHSTELICKPFSSTTHHDQRGASKHLGISETFGLRVNSGKHIDSSHLFRAFDMVPNLHRFSALTSPSETRLLELYPAKTTSQLLSGGLRVVSLDDKHDYEALSYEWGSMELTQKLYLDDGSYVAITESLFHALRDIRHERNELLVWADGVCINQSDLKEREQQVSSMGFIFRKAKNVITYIGPESDDSSLGIELADKLSQCGKVWLGPGHASDASDGLPSETDPAWKAVRKLILRGWVRLHIVLHRTTADILRWEDAGAHKNSSLIANW